MIDFAVFALPRSGTTWATAWLNAYANTTHDPIENAHLAEILAWEDRGICCTASWMFPGFVRTLKARSVPIVILDRPLDHVNASLGRLRLPTITNSAYARFHDLPGARYPYTDLFDPSAARDILKTLLGDGVVFDTQLHREFADMHITLRAEVIQRMRKYRGD